VLLRVSHAGICGTDLHIISVRPRQAIGLQRGRAIMQSIMKAKKQMKYVVFIEK
jgi:threonine dehydrogenase-like Zn-dependent dehydrogenase